MFFSFYVFLFSKSGKSFAGKTHFNFDIEIKVVPSFFLKNISFKEGKLSTKKLTAWGPLFIDLP
jgi:hypothetical protein